MEQGWIMDVTRPTFRHSHGWGGIGEGLGCRELAPNANALASNRITRLEVWACIGRPRLLRDRPIQPSLTPRQAQEGVWILPDAMLTTRWSSWTRWIRWIRGIRSTRSTRWIRAHTPDIAIETDITRPRRTQQDGLDHHHGPSGRILTPRP